MTIITHKGKVRNGAVTPMFISKWDTTQAGSANDTVVLPLVGDGDYDFFVDWGDGNRDNITVYNQSEVTHQYSSTGIYEIKIHGGISGWEFNGVGDDDKIIEIGGWGPLRFVDDNGIFEGCSNLNNISSATPLILDLRQLDDLFRSCSNLDGDVGNFDTSNCTAIIRTFFDCTNFNNGGSPSISGWDISNVTEGNGLYQTFQSCTNFNQPIGAWDTSSIRGAFSTFNGATSFNQDLSNWNVTGITTMQQMFKDASNFNNGDSTGINNWRPSSCTNMYQMFYKATGFNQPIGDWDVSSVTNMGNMFDMDNLGSAFDQDLSNWNTSSATNMGVMFRGSSFNNSGLTGINNWNTSNVTNMYYMFKGTSFNQPIGSWDVGKVTNMQNMFQVNNIFDQDIGDWNVTGVTTMREMFNGNYSNFNNGGSTGINNWRPSSCTDMYGMFYNCTGFNQPIGDWDVSSVTSMSNMFTMSILGSPFNQDLSNWDTSSCTNMSNLFLRRDSFNNGGSPGISGWNTSNVTNMQYLFLACSSFDQPLDGWDVSNVTNMYGMLEGYQGPMAFNNGGSTGINNWQPSSCTNMTRVFEECTGFNQPLNGWDVSSATTMDYMFSRCTSFNQPLNNWDTSSVTNMSNMFSYALNFDQDLGSWNTSNVTSMNMMFGHSTSGLFNNGGSSSISEWDRDWETYYSYLLQNLYPNY